jgi:hypothetical protein
MTDNIDLSEFLATEPNTTSVPVVVTGGKIKKTKQNRAKPYSKKEGDAELQEMRKKAEAMCSCWEQAKIVRRYKKERLKEFIEQKEFDSAAALRESVFTFAHKAYATAIDFLTKGDGHVADSLGSDLTLRTAIEDEGHEWIKYLNNKSKIVFLTVSDTYEGKMEQSDKKKSESPVCIEIVTNDEKQSHGEAAVYTGDIPGSDATDDAPDEQILPMREGEEEMSPAVEAVPCDPTAQTPCHHLGGQEGQREDCVDSEAPQVE